jgi:hypothetical protein
MSKLCVLAAALHMLPSCLQEHARDSFENVLFSLCRFFELTGHYPVRMTAVSYTLKQQRFEQLHRAAVRFPAAAFHFIGTPVPEGATGAAAVSLAGKKVAHVAA